MSWKQFLPQEKKPYILYPKRKKINSKEIYKKRAVKFSGPQKTFSRVQTPALCVINITLLLKLQSNDKEKAEAKDFVSTLLKKRSKENFEGVNLFH